MAFSAVFITSLHGVYNTDGSSAYNQNYASSSKKTENRSSLDSYKNLNNFEESFDTTHKVTETATEDQIPDKRILKTDFTENQNKTIAALNENKLPDNKEGRENPEEEREYFHEEKEINIVYDPNKSPLDISINPVKKTDTGQSSVSPAITNTVSRMIGFSSSSLQIDQNEVKINQPITYSFEKVPNQQVLDSLRFYPELKFSKQLQGNTLTIFPENMERSTTYTFGLKYSGACPPVEGGNCQSNQEWAYAHSFRSSYKETRVYGKSVEGRDLVAHFFGKSDENGTKIMLTGGIHGEEWRSGDLSRFVDYLNNNPQEIIHQNKSFVIVPFTNPDSSRIERRYNSNGVNLNRNWPAYWEPGYNRGPYPLSEPEVKHLYDLTLAEMPDYLISYHSQWPPYGIIFPGDEKIPETMDFAYWVANKTGYPVGLYPYEAIVAGDQAVWAESVGIRSLIIEAVCKKCYDWEQNFPLYLAMLREL